MNIQLNPDQLLGRVVETVVQVNKSLHEDLLSYHTQLLSQQENKLRNKLMDLLAQNHSKERVQVHVLEQRIHQLESELLREKTQFQEFRQNILSLVGANNSLLGRSDAAAKTDSPPPSILAKTTEPRDGSPTAVSDVISRAPLLTSGFQLAQSHQVQHVAQDSSIAGLLSLWNSAAAPAGPLEMGFGLRGHSFLHNNLSHVVMPTSTSTAGMTSLVQPSSVLGMSQASRQVEPIAPKSEAGTKPATPLSDVIGPRLETGNAESETIVKEADDSKSIDLFERIPCERFSFPGSGGSGDAMFVSNPFGNRKDIVLSALQSERSDGGQRIVVWVQNGFVYTVLQQLFDRIVKSVYDPPNKARMPEFLKYYRAPAEGERVDPTGAMVVLRVNEKAKLSSCKLCQKPFGSKEHVVYGFKVVYTDDDSGSETAGSEPGSKKKRSRTTEFVRCTSHGYHVVCAAFLSLMTKEPQCESFCCLGLAPPQREAIIPTCRPSIYIR